MSTHIKRALKKHNVLLSRNGVAEHELRDWLVQAWSFPFYTAEMFTTCTGAQTIFDLQYVGLNDLQQQLFPRPLVNNFFLSEREYEILVKMVAEVRRQTRYKSLEMEEEERQGKLWGELAAKQVAYRQGLETKFGTLRDWLIHQGFAANIAEQLTSFLRMHKLEDLQHGNKERLDEYNEKHPLRLLEWEYNTMLSNFDLERSYYQSQQYRNPGERKRAREQQQGHARTDVSLASSDAHRTDVSFAKYFGQQSLSLANQYFV